MCRYKLHVFDTKRGDKEKKVSLDFKVFWIQFFLILKSVLYRGFFKGLLKGCMQKHLLYTETCAIDLPYMEGN